MTTHTVPRCSKYYFASCGNADLYDDDVKDAKIGLIYVSTVQEMLEEKFASRVLGISTENATTKVIFDAYGQLCYCVVSVMEYPERAEAAEIASSAATATAAAAESSASPSDDVASSPAHETPSSLTKAVSAAAAASSKYKYKLLQNEDASITWRRYLQHRQETPATLRRSLKLFHRLLRFRVPNIYLQSTYKFGSTVIKADSVKYAVKPLLDTMYLMSLHGSYSVLVQAVEYLDCGRINRSMIAEAIESAIAANEHRYRGLVVHHAVLLVRTKLVSVYSRKHSFTLLPSDILNLIIYAYSLFYIDPSVPVAQSCKPPDAAAAASTGEEDDDDEGDIAANPSRNNNSRDDRMVSGFDKIQLNGSSEGGSSGGGVLIAGASIPVPSMTDSTRSLESATNMASSTDSDSLPMGMRNGPISPANRSRKGSNKRGLNKSTSAASGLHGEDRPLSPSLLSEEDGLMLDDEDETAEYFDAEDASLASAPCVSRPLSPSTPLLEDDVGDYGNRQRQSESINSGKKTNEFDFVFLHNTPNLNQNQLSKYAVYAEYDPEHSTTLLLICDPTNYINVHQSHYYNQYNMNASASAAAGGVASSVPVASSYLGAGRTATAAAATAGRRPAGNQHHHQRMPSVDDADSDLASSSDDDDMQHQCADLTLQIQERLKTFSSFLSIKEYAHMTMRHYLHYCPGLIHFILVDRLRGTMLAPRIVSLSATVNESGDGLADPFGEYQQQASDDIEQIEFLREKVWEMYGLASQIHDDHYSSSTGEPFTEIGVSSRGVQYWFQEWAEDEQGNPMKLSANSLRENAKYMRAHYELYTMYLPFVSTQQVAQNNKVLVQLLMEQHINRE